MSSQNLHSFNVEHVERFRPHLLQHRPDLRLVSPSEPDSEPDSPRPLLQTPAAERTGAHPSNTPSTPSQPVSLPVSHRPRPSSEPDLHGPDGIFTPPAAARPFGRPVLIEGPYRRVPAIPPLAPYQQPDWEASMNAAMLTDFRDELARLDGVITPGIDNTPYVQYAIEALTRGRDTDYSGTDVSGSGTSASDPALRSGQQPQLYQPRGTQQHPSAPAPPPARPPVAHPPVQTARPDVPNQQLPLPHIPGARESAHSLAESLLKKGPRPPQPHEWRSVEKDELLANAPELPPLSFRPWPLRAPALFAFMAVCILMIAALIFSAVYSHLRRGLLAWATIHGGRYFIFRILPQLIGAAMLLYVQFVATTMVRILPFVRLAATTQEGREGALFQELYPTFLWPRLVGPWNVWVFTLVTWLTNFTIPLQSSLFTVILVDQTWTWATVQGVAWALVALYLALLAAIIIIWRFWASLDNTGLLWDPRSLADIAALVSETNTAEDYRGTQLARTREGIRFALRRRAADRLGYWTWKDGRHGFWHTIGSPMDETNLVPIPDLAAGRRMQRHDEKQGVLTTTEGADHEQDHDMEARASTPARHRYLPWCLRNNQLLWFSLTAFILILAIFVASFLPSTRIFAGFAPSLRADPQPGAFSAADFLYSFIPSLLGMIVFLTFQPLDIIVRVLQPWAALSSPSGAPADRSLLADYAACAPVQCTLHALRNRHWRVAAISLLSTLFVLIPVLAGGCFMALTTAEREVRMFPNVPAYAILLALLVLYLLALVSLFPARAQFRMPHAVLCLAEIIGYLVTPEMRGEPAFKRCVSRDEMAGKMGIGRGLPADVQSRWAFGFGETGQGDEEELGIRRMRRFTEKRRVRKSQIRPIRTVGERL